MKKYIQKVILGLMILLMSTSIFSALPFATAGSTTVRVIPSPIPLGEGHVNVVGTEFTFAVVIEDVTELWAFTVKLYVNQTYFEYVSHVSTVPVEDYSEPIDPSPYAGILHADKAALTKVKDEYDPSTGILEVSYSTTAPSTPFNGSGTVCIVTLRLKNQPFTYEIEPADYINILIDFKETKLAGYGLPPPPISHDVIPGVVELWSRPFTYPPLPKLKVLGSEAEAEISGYALGEQFTVDVWMSNLDPFWDVAGVDMYLNFNGELLNATDVVLDPDGSFASFWPHGIYEVAADFNNTEGWVHMAFIGVGGTEHSPPYGTFKLATIIFKVIFESETYPPASTVLFLRNPGSRPVVILEGVPYECPVDLAGFPHPDRPMSPWNGVPYSVPIPHYVENATFISPFKPPGRWIDLYTQYPNPYGGQGPGQDSDAFGPQMEVILYAEVLYNLWPIQNKLVTFEIIGPEGTSYHYVYQGITNETGVTMTTFRLPWQCDDPESIFGTWTVIATVDIAEETVTDILHFEANYLIDIVSITPSKDVYAIGEHMQFGVIYRSISAQTREAYLAMVIEDDLGVPIASMILGPFNVTEGMHSIMFECMEVPKWTFVGEGTVEVNVLTGLPENGGTAYCPAETISIGLTVPP